MRNFVISCLVGLSTITVGGSLVEANAEQSIAQHQTTSIRIGQPLALLNQGVHQSVESGRYIGNGEYTINMRDGGIRGRIFKMHFRLVAVGDGLFHLVRIDCDAPVEVLSQRTNGVLTGGAYTLNFS